jgi:hypothetical protein
MGGVVPGLNDKAVFDNTSNVACSVDIPATIAGIRITSDYTGRIYSNTIQVSTGSQAGGTLECSLIIDGGIFDWTGGTMGWAGGGGLSPFTRVMSNSRINISGDTNKHLNGRSLEIDGLAHWTGAGDIVLGITDHVPALISVVGTFEARASGAIVRTDDRSAFDNGGLFISAPANHPTYGATTRIICRFVNSGGGVVRIESGNMGLYRTSSTAGNGTFDSPDGVYDISKCQLDSYICGWRFPLA